MPFHDGQLRQLHGIPSHMHNRTPNPSLISPFMSSQRRRSSLACLSLTLPTHHSPSPTSFLVPCSCRSCTVFSQSAYIRLAFDLSTPPTPHTAYSSLASSTHHPFTLLSLLTQASRSRSLACLLRNHCSNSFLHSLAPTCRSSRTIIADRLRNACLLSLDSIL